jgi:hypothetical protein
MELILMCVGVGGGVVVGDTGRRAEASDLDFVNVNFVLFLCNAR